uniref:Uncharacterized protein n=1 Tax=Meloidogyne incognita TaxID=6306 RepID=A0A914KFF1_MELIC
MIVFWYCDQGLLLLAPQAKISIREGWSTIVYFYSFTFFQTCGPGKGLLRYRHIAKLT